MTLTKVTLKAKQRVRRSRLKTRPKQVLDKLLQRCRVWGSGELDRGGGERKGSEEGAKGELALVTIFGIHANSRLLIKTNQNATAHVRQFLLFLGVSSRLLLLFS